MRRLLSHVGLRADHSATRESPSLPPLRVATCRAQPVTPLRAAQKLNHGLKSSRNTAGLALDDVAQSMRARMLCDTLLPLYSEAGEVLRATARAHETVDMCED